MPVTPKRAAEGAHDCRGKEVNKLKNHSSRHGIPDRLTWGNDPFVLRLSQVYTIQWKIGKHLTHCGANRVWLSNQEQTSTSIPGLSLCQIAQISDYQV